jgi:ribonuclease D
MFRQIVKFVQSWLRRLHILPKYPKKISKVTLQQLPVRFYEGDIRFVNDIESAKEAGETILRENLLGFDTESKPSFSRGEKHNPSIVQMATASRVYIFQLDKTDRLKFLKPIFEDERILKVGIAIRDDVLKLRDIENFQLAGFKDISDLTKMLGIEQTGLRNLAGILLKCRISKASQVTGWSQENLSARQLTYAATDAWISRELYLKILEQMR